MTSKNFSALIALVLALYCFVGSAEAQSDKRILNALDRLLSVEESQTDLARAKLMIDKMVDPGISIKSGLEQIEAIATAVDGIVSPNASSDQRVAALRSYLYRAGPWNDNRPFKYDLEDPLGHHLPSKLLPNYLESRLGNCVSMPFLFIAVADRMGLNVTASTAPHHVFVKYTDDSGKNINLETTSGANPARDEWIRQNMPMTDEAIENGAYLKTLSKRETLVVMAMVLVEHAEEEGRYGTALNLVNLLLPHYPNFVDLYVARGSAAYKILETRFYSQYPRPIDIPVNERGYFQHLTDLNRQAFAQAEALGWRPESNPN